MRLKLQSFSNSSSFVRKISTPLSDYVLIGIALLSVLMYMAQFLLGSIPLYTFALLFFVWLIYYLKSHHLSYRTPLNFSIMALLIVATLGVLISTDLDLFLPKLSGLLIGVSTFFVIVNFLRFRQRLNLVIFLLLFLSLAVALLTFFGTEWPEDGLGFINQLYGRLPNLPFFSEREGINKNTMGGALAFFPPLLLSLLWDNDAFSRFKSRYPGLSNLPGFFYKAMVLTILLIVLFALFLTQSRGAWLGCAAGVMLFCILKNKRFLWIVPILIVLFLFILFRYADGSLTLLLSFLDTSQEATLTGRLDVWQKAFVILQDFSITGISLGSFGEIYFPYFSSIVFPLEADVIFHPHNTLLSVAVEVGFPGLILYASLLGSIAAMFWKTNKTTRSINRVIAVGLACGIAAFFVFGLMDAYTLGRNLEIIFWIYIGVLTALFVHEDALNSTKASQTTAQSAIRAITFNPLMIKHNIKFLFLLLLVWFLGILFSLSLIHISIIAAFLIAIIFGLVFGIYKTNFFQRTEV